MCALPVLDVLNCSYPFSYGMTQVDYFDREDATSHLSQTRLVYLGTEFGCLRIHIQQLPLLCKDNDTRVRALFAGGLNEICKL